MANKEHCSMVKRAPKRKANNTYKQTPPTKKNRVVLGQISSNILASFNANIQSESRKARNDQPVKKATQFVPPADFTFIDLTDESPNGIDVINSDDDPQMCAPYATEIYDYLRQMEKEEKRRPLSSYIEKVQKDISVNMRGILVDWLVEVADEYKLQSDTLYLATSYIDRYLSVNPLPRKKLQLLGVSAMLVASKYEEINPPQVQDFCFITDNTYSKEEVVSMESSVLKALKFEMGNPTVKTFLRKFNKVSQENLFTIDYKFEFVGYYLAELSLLAYECLRFLPSLVAASVIFLAKFTIEPRKHPWDLAMQEYSGYKPSDLEKCVLILHDLQLGKKGGHFVAIRDKYKHQKFKYVSILMSPSNILASYFKDLDH